MITTYIGDATQAPIQMQALLPSGLPYNLSAATEIIMFLPTSTTPVQKTLTSGAITKITGGAGGLFGLTWTTTDSGSFLANPNPGKGVDIYGVATIAGEPQTILFAKAWNVLVRPY